MSDILQVHEFNSLINDHLQTIKPLVVEGEISELNISRNKWLFMTIKDEQASVQVFGMVFRLSNVSVLEEGMKVHVYGRPRLYEPSGRFSLSADKIVPAGEGALRLAYEKLKAQLEKEGLFDISHKRTLPTFPRRIGLITAKRSKAYSDFVKILEERMGGIKIYFSPVKVQGKNSVETLLQAFSYFNQNQDDLELDALIMTRGGGSLEDLLSFNDEKVARAVFSSKVPVISGIGHEEDVALTDLVADVRASTPSNAAELLTKPKDFFLQRLDQLVYKLNQGVNQQLISARELIDDQVRILNEYYVDQAKRVQNLIHRLSKQVLAVQHRTSQLETKVDNQQKNLINQARNTVKTKQERVKNLERLLTNLDYRNLLKKGYSITRDTSGNIIKDIKQVSKKDQIVTTLDQGKINSEVTQIINNQE
jgi:exodeoxyribonuclease VII large subunit